MVDTEAAQRHTHTHMSALRLCAFSGGVWVMFPLRNKRLGRAAVPRGVTREGDVAPADL